MEEILPDFVLADLFPSSLVLIESTIPIKKEEKNEKWYLGNNGKNVSILVNESDAVYINEDSLSFLTKILGACKLNMGDIAVINIARTPTNFESIKKELAPNTCILFDVKAEKIVLPFTVPHYQIQNYGGCSFLMAPSFSSFDGDSTEAKLAKTKLWVSLRSIFNL